MVLKILFKILKQKSLNIFTYLMNNFKFKTEKRVIISYWSVEVYQIDNDNTKVQKNERYKKQLEILLSLDSNKYKAILLY
jgi:hypothetical protein